MRIPRPTRGRCVLRIVRPDMSEGGLHLPQRRTDANYELVMGRVLAVGAPGLTSAGIEVATEVKEGDLVAIGTALVLPYRGEEYLLVGFADVLAILPEGSEPS